MSIRRREFLKTSLMAGAAVPVPLSAWARVAGANEAIRVGVAGINGMGWGHVERFHSRKGVRVVALCDPDRGLLGRRRDEFEKKEKEKLETFADIREMLDKADLDVVVVATPDHWHALAAVWAMQAGKDVYVEKPLTYCIWEGRQLVAAARRYGRIAQTGSQHRSCPATHKIRDYVQSGKLGRIQWAYAQVFNRRKSIGRAKGPLEIPPDVDYDLYEFTEKKDVFRHVEKFETRPWTVEVTGLVSKPRTYGIEELLKMPLEERHYRFRCVEAWYMNIPWVGVPLRRLLEATEPLSKARYVRLVSFLAPEQAPGQKVKSYRWPYYEALTLAEAMNELTLATVGVYGKELTKQNGAPFRVIVPWKYGYKGAKSVVRIELVEKRPGTFWNDLYPREYSFESNVDPTVPHPRWSQAQERHIDMTGNRPTLPYNGYGQWVAGLYS